MGKRVFHFSIIIMIMTLCGTALGSNAETGEEKILKKISFYDTFPGKLALTFDDGPDPDITPQILDILKENNIKATFFVVGKNAAKYPELIKRIIGEGHTIGNHTYNHINMKTSAPDAVLKELDMTEKAVNNALGYDYEFKQVRPPWGDCDPAVEKLISDRGEEMILWQIDSEDWRDLGKPWVIKTVDWESRKGGVVLFHDTLPVTPQALKEIIREMKNTEFLTVDELISEKYDGKNLLTSIYFDNRPLGDNGILVNDMLYMSAGFFSKETGINFTKKPDTREVIFAGSNYRYFLVAKQPFIPVEYFAEDFELKVEKDDKKINLYYPSIFLNGTSLYKKAFIYKEEIYIPLKDTEYITGIKAQWDSDKKTVHIGEKEVKTVEWGGVLFMPLSSLYEFGVVKINRDKGNVIDISFGLL